MPDVPGRRAEKVRQALAVLLAAFLAPTAALLLPARAGADEAAADRIADLFALRLTLPADPARPGTTLDAVVEAFHPYTGEPLPGRFERPGADALRLDARSAQGPSDAVEREVEVGFDGVERVRTIRRLLPREGSAAEIRLEVPRFALPGSGRLEVVLYEGLGDHLAGALQELRRRPTGCAEQTASQGWISLLLSDLLAARGEDDSPAAAEARRDLLAAQEKLARFRNGGFAYWTGAPADEALTAYVLDFLRAARRHVEVDEHMLAGAASWLRRQLDGEASGVGWRAWAALAVAGLTSEDDTDAEANRTAAEEAHEALADEHADAYTLALRALTAEALGEDADEARRRLARLAEAGDGVARWPARVATPFYGRGLAGNLEATALAVRALSGAERYHRLRDGGLVYLLENKDGRGTWLSTQATVQVLRALTAAFGGGTDAGATGAAVAVALDGEDTRTLPRSPAPGVPAAPLTAPLAKGRHRLAVVTEGTQGDGALLQATVRWYEPWRRLGPAENGLSLTIGCAPSELRVGETVTCDVTAARATPESFGMLIAEVGLPPGAEVDRGSLKQMVASNRDVWGYEVWTNRVVVYLWPRRQETAWRFLWRPRFVLRARSAPSRLYDYYSPDEETLVAPLDFRVEAERQDLK